MREAVVDTDPDARLFGAEAFLRLRGVVVHVHRFSVERLRADESDDVVADVLRERVRVANVRERIDVCGQVDLLPLALAEFHPRQFADDDARRAHAFRDGVDAQAIGRDVDHVRVAQRAARIEVDREFETAQVGEVVRVGDERAGIVGARAEGRDERKERERARSER